MIAVSRVRRAAALAVVSCGLVLAPPASAHALAGDLCESGVVHDEADVLDDRSVADAAASLLDDRVTVKVIAWQETPGGGTLYDALVAAREECGGWGFLPGEDRSLLVLGVSVGGRQLGSHYDGEAFDRFEEARDDVEVARMGAAFGNGQWTEGMVGGLEGYATAYDDAGSAAALPWVIGVPVGFAVLTGAGIGGTRLRRRLKERSAARAGLSTAVSDMAQAWFELDESNELIDARVQGLAPVSDSVADAIRAAHAEAVVVRDGATETYLRLSEVHTATEIARKDTDDAVPATRDVEEASRALREARQAMATVDVRLTAYDTLREELPGRTEELRGASAEVSALLAARRTEGYTTTDNDPAPHAAEQAAVAVAALAAERRFGDAEALLVHAQADLAAHRTWLTELVAFRAALVEDAARLRARAIALDAVIADAYVTTGGLERDQDPSCLEGVRAAVDGAAAERRALDVALTTIEAHSSMATQQFARAREEIVAAEQAVESIVTGAAVPPLRVEQLRSLAVDLPLRAERAVVEADAVQGQVTTHPAAMTFLADIPDVSTLRAGAVAVGEDATVQRPPWLRLDQRLAEAEAGLTRARAVVDEGIAAHEASQRALENASSAIAAARDQVAGRDVSSAARELLEEARSLLAGAEAETGSLASITSGADAAKAGADAAAARARQDQRDAEQRREAARRAAAAASRRSSGGGGSSRSGGGGSRSSGGGGSRGFSGGGGSRSSGGGGSRGF